MFLPALPQGAHILIVRLSAIGDVVQSTTVAKNLKRLRPDCHITWLVSPPAAELLEENPCIDRLLVWDRRPFDEASAHGRLLQMLAMLKEGRALLRQYDYDVALDIQCLFLTGLLTRLSGARRCIGIKERHEGNRFFMTTVAPAIDDPHKIRHYMTSLLPLGFDWKDFRPGTSLALREEERLWARDFLGQQGLSARKSRPLLLVAIRTTWEDKHPEPEVFAKALAPSGRASRSSSSVQGVTAPISRPASGCCHRRPEVSRGSSRSGNSPPSWRRRRSSSAATQALSTSPRQSASRPSPCGARRTLPSTGP